MLAARLDSLPRGERRVVQAAAVVGHTFWEGSIDPGDASIDLSAALLVQEKDLIVLTAGSRLAGEREYAFKHVLIRDVAYSTLPRPCARAATPRLARSRRGSGRPEGLVAMVAEHYGRAASLGAAADLSPASSSGSRSARRGAGGSR